MSSRRHTPSHAHVDVEGNGMDVDGAGDASYDAHDTADEATEALLHGQPVYVPATPRNVKDMHNRCCDNRFWCIKVRLSVVSEVRK